MRIGEYKLHSIISGRLMLDGGAMYGVVPKPLWEKNSPADERNRIKLLTRHLLLESKTKKILIDTGSGSSWNEKFQKIYSTGDSYSAMESSLKSVGFEREDITDVILTHLHFDHAGGAVKFENETVKPSFPNAK